ncbi:Prefoldin chaperone subunit family protein [Euphorbia peplus]|nr:Prefoldin chaperone subunit family protein [Euphorbia peplus]
MAKKKINNHNPKPTPQPPAMDDSQGQLQNLKSLNEVILKETMERRNQVESLLQAKESLEFQLNQTADLNTLLKTECARESEERVCLEIEKGLFSVFIETQMDAMAILVRSLMSENGEKEGKIGVLKGVIDGLKGELDGERERFSGICRQRDRLAREVEERNEEVDGLKGIVVELEEKKIQAEDEIRKVNEFYSQSLEELKKKKELFDEVRRLRDVAEKELAMKVNAVEDLNRNLGEIARKKNEIERENREKKVKIGELEKQLSKYSETVSSLRKEEGNLRFKLTELETNYAEAVNMAKVISEENVSLAEEKKEKEATIVKLMEEMDSRERLLKSLNTELKDKEGLTVTLLREKEEIEDVKVSKENEVLKLNDELIGVTNAVVAMQESIKIQEEQNKHLASEVCHYRATLEQVKLEKDNAERDLDKETKNNRNLMARVLEMEKKVEESVQEFAKMKNQHGHLLDEKRGLESELGLLRKEKESVQDTLSEARREVNHLRTKVESIDSNSVRALTMIKKTAELVSDKSENGNEVLSSTERTLDDIEPYATEIEVIKRAFRSKETAVEEMKQQIIFLQNSVAKASKQKGLLAIVSSATTFLFAVSVAYVARLR